MSSVLLCKVTNLFTDMESSMLLETQSVLSCWKPQSILCCCRHGVFCVATDVVCCYRHGVFCVATDVVCCYRHGVFCVATDVVCCYRHGVFLCCYRHGVFLCCYRHKVYKVFCVVTDMKCFVLLQTWSVLCSYRHGVFCVATDMECFVLVWTWSVLCSYGHGVFCVLTDAEPPVFANCPSAVREVSYLSSAFFSEPVASDNVMVSELSVTPNDYRVSNVIQTDLQVSYVARDHAANIGSCVVNIRVKGKESLLVFSCLVLT